MTTKTTNATYICSQDLPTAKIAINKGLVKHYGNKVYLSDGQEFQIELFNPKTTPVLAQIYFNDKKITNSGFVLLPGQRVWIERFIDENCKFKFNTYFVENNEATKKAIEKNGKVRIEFYNERMIFSSNYYTIDNNWWNQNPSWIFKSDCINTNYCNTNYCNSNLDIKRNYLGDISYFNINNTTNLNQSNIETGRIEKGALSNQSFKNYNGEFEQYYFHSINYQLLPFSQKPQYMKDLKRKCFLCGTKIKNNKAKFCELCGSKL